MGTAFMRSTRLHFSYLDPLLSSVCMIVFITDPLIQSFLSPQLMEEKVRMLSPAVCMQDVYGCEGSWQQYEHV